MNETKSAPYCAAVYIRVSTDEQTELSPETQMEKIQEYARKEGIRVLREHIYVDAGISGKKAEKRPAFMRMIAAAKGKDCPFSMLLVWKFSRFARNQEESIFYKSILRSKCGVDVVSVSEPLIAGHFGSLIERIIEWMDEFYSIRLSEEVKRSMEVNARRGKLQTTASFGYRADGGRLVPVPEEAKVVRKIFSDFCAGAGLFSIARELNAMGIRTHRGNPFENRTVAYILCNPVYIGKIRWNPAGRTRRSVHSETIITADGEHEPIIDADTWRQAQRRMAEVKAHWGNKARPGTEYKHWISGVVRCSACGAALVFSAPHYFKCGSYAKGRCTHSQHIRADYLAEALLSKLAHDAESKEELSYEITCTDEKREHQLDAMQATLRQLEKKASRLQEAYLAGVVNLDGFSAAKQEIDAEIDRIRADRDALLQKTDRDCRMEAMQRAIRSAIHTLSDPSKAISAKNSAARSVIETCTWDKATGTLTVLYRYFLE